MTASPPFRLESALRALESAASAGLQSLGERHRLGQIGPEAYRSLRHQLLVTLRRDLAAPADMRLPVSPHDADRTRPLEPPVESMPRPLPLGKWAGLVVLLLGICIAIAVIAQR